LSGEETVNGGKQLGLVKNFPVTVTNGVLQPDFPGSSGGSAVVAVGK
jgi:hypothetical protein